MTNQELQAKLVEAEEEIEYLKVFKKLHDAKDEGNVLIVRLIAQYKCETCMLYHFPEPVKSCLRKQGN